MKSPTNGIGRASDSGKQALLVGVAAGSFLGAIRIDRHWAVALRVAAGLIGLGVAGFVEIAAQRVAAGLVALLGQVALVEVLIGSAIDVLTGGLVAFVVVGILIRIYRRLILGEVILILRHGGASLKSGTTLAPCTAVRAPGLPRYLLPSFSRAARNSGVS